MSYEAKIETQRDIHTRITDELVDVHIALNLSFHLTSIYDNSIYESFSKIIQKQIPQLPTLENILNIFCSYSGIEKTFLVDIHTRIYISTDSSPVDMQSYELCSDVLNVYLELCSIYSYGFDSDSFTLVRLGNMSALYARAISDTLVCVCLVRGDSGLERVLSILEANFVVVKDAVLQVKNVSKD